MHAEADMLPSHRRNRALAILNVFLLLIPALSGTGCSNSLNPLGVNREITIEVQASGNGIGRVTGPSATKINCSIDRGSALGACRESFVDAGAGGIFALDAVADTTSTFAGFSGDCSGAVCNLSFPQGSDTTFNVTARFVLLPPIVAIAKPLDNASIPSNTPSGAQGVEFEAVGSDRTGRILNDFTWVSSIQGTLCAPVAGYGCGKFREDLTPGVHTITSTVADQAGTRSSASIRVTVIAPGNFPPEAEIVTPASGNTLPGDQPVRLGGFGRDQEDGLLPDASLAWSSDVSGALGSGANINVVVTPGMHRIRLTATDSRGATGIDTVTITVTPPPGAPGSISGSVTGNGYGVGGATLTLTGPVSRTTSSGSAGAYSFVQLPPGIYTVSVSTPLNITFPLPVQTVVLLAGQHLVVNFAGVY
jgi:hypothetical protein